MKVKDLINDLKEFDPEMRVRFHTASRLNLECLSIYVGELKSKQKKECVEIDIGKGNE